jgi:hypothetical protein
MTYVDAFWNRDRNTIEVVERVNGQRVMTTWPTRFLVGWPSGKGRHKSIFGTDLEVFETNKYEEFQRELRMIDRAKQFESDINPVFRCFYDHYKNAPLPKLNVAFWDIETGWDPVRGFSSPNEAFNPITAISVYCNWLDRNFTLVIKPNLLTKKESLDIVNKFDDTVLCESEAELLDTFLHLVDDADVISGWNCLDLNSPIFCSDRILMLKDVKSGQILQSGAVVKNTHRAGLKKTNVLKTVHGHSLVASDEHKIPVYIKKPNEFKNLNTLMKTLQDCEVGQIKKLMHDHDVFVEINPHTNSNKDYTYKQFILENWEDVFGMGLDFSIDHPVWKKNLQLTLGYNSQNYNLTYNKVKNHISKPEIISYFESQECVQFMFNRKTGGFSLNINEPICNESLQLLGTIYTDGHYSNYDRHFSIANTNSGIHDGCQKKLQVLGLHGSWKFKDKDGCSYLTFKGSCVIGLLMPMIYEQHRKYVKKLNISMLSRLSYSQFASFVSGLLDGDGSVTPWDVNICNFNNDIDTMNLLLTWNGVFTTVAKSYVRIPYWSINQPFLHALTLSHDQKAAKLRSAKIKTLKNSPNKKINKYIVNQHKIIIKLHSITESDQCVPMGDIETSDQYFVANGIRVHNSSSFDIPYIHNRIVQVMGKEHTKRLCLWNKFPKKREYEMFGKTHVTYDLFGRVHLDYLDLYRKHTYHEMHSYRLDFVGEYEVGEKKIAYEGNLDKLYNHDFEKFIAYSRQDVMLLVKIDQKLKFIELSNALAHENGVLLSTTLGSVMLIDNAITNEAHDLGLLIPARQRSAPEKTNSDDLDSDNEPQGIVGAYVADPVRGVHQWIGGVDINSLYPSAIRSLNMSKETVVGQIRSSQTDRLIARRMKEEKRSFADSWNEMFGTLEYNQLINREMVMLTVDFEDGTTVELTADELYQWIFDNPSQKLIVTANGTIFDGSKQGIVPGLLARWYSERKQLQAKAKGIDKFKEGVAIPEALANKINNLLQSTQTQG